MVKSAHISWVKKLCSDDSTAWTVYPKLIFGVEFLYTHVVTKNKNRCKQVSHPFYKVLWQTWNGFYNKEPANEEEVLNEALWHNERICINNQPIAWKKWKEAGILKIPDLFSDHNQFMSTQEILAIYGVQASFCYVLQLRAAIPWLRGLVVSDHRPRAYDLLIGYKTKTINLYSLTSKNIYGVLLDNLTHVSKAKDKWCQQFPEEQFDGQKWSICYTMAFKASRETKIQSLQFKILHRIVPCKEYLFKRKGVDSPECEYCEQTDNLLHFFMECPRVAGFLNNAKRWTNNVLQYSLEELDCRQFLLGLDGNDQNSKVKNFLALNIKFYIYRQRLFHKKHLDLFEWIRELKYKLLVENTIAKRENKRRSVLPISQLLQRISVL